MSLSDIYLLCFAIGSLWSLAALLLGGLHFHHPAHFGHGHAHAGHHHGSHHGGHGPLSSIAGLLASVVNPSCLAIFLAWFGGTGYLLTRHSGLTFWIGLGVAVVFGLGGALVLAGFLRFLESRERPLDPADYEFVGVLGRVSSQIRASGVGEVIYIRDGARRPLPARSEDGTVIGRGEEVIVTRYEKGIAYVRTWEAMTRETKPLPKEI